MLSRASFNVSRSIGSESEAREPLRGGRPRGRKMVEAVGLGEPWGISRFMASWERLSLNHCGVRKDVVPLHDGL